MSTKKTATSSTKIKDLLAVDNPYGLTKEQRVNAQKFLKTGRVPASVKLVEVDNLLIKSH